MKCRTLIAIICVVIMVSCPFASFFSEAEVKDGMKSSAMVTVSDISSAEIGDIFDTSSNKHVMEYWINDMIFPSLSLNSMIKNYLVESKFVNFRCTTGQWIDTANDKTERDVKQILSISGDIDFKFNIDTSSKELLITDTAPFQGEGQRQLSYNIQTTLDHVKSLEIIGSVSIVILTDTELDRIQSHGQGGYSPYDQVVKISSKQSHNLNVKVNSKSYTDVYNEEYKYTTKASYDVNMWSIEGLMYACCSGSEKYDYFKSEGTKKINSYSDTLYPYEHIPVSTEEYTYGPKISSGPGHITMEISIAYNELFLLTHYADEKTLIEKLDKYKATQTKNVEDFNKLYDSMKSQFQSSGSDNSTMLIIVIVVIVLIILAAAAYCIYVRL